MWARIRDQKTLILALLVVVIGLLVLVFVPTGRVGDPFHRVGDALLIAGLMGLIYEQLVRRENDRAALERLTAGVSEGLKPELSNLREDLHESVARAIALSPEDRLVLLSTEQRTLSARASLISVLGEEVGRGVWSSSIDPLLSGAGDRYYLRDYRVDVYLSLSAGPFSETHYALALHSSAWVQWTRKDLVFCCCDDRVAHATCCASPLIEYSYYLSGIPTDKLSACFVVSPVKVRRRGDPSYVELQLSKLPDSLRRLPNVHGVAYSDVRLQEWIGQEIEVQYTVETLVPKAGMLFFTKLTHPTKGLTISLDTGDTPLTMLEVCSLLVCEDPATIGPKASPNGLSQLLRTDGWVFPNSGAVFAWGEGRG